MAITACRGRRICSGCSTRCASCRRRAVPELPDIEVYLSALEPRIVGQTLQRIRLGSPFLLRSVDPPLKAFEGRAIRSLSRLGKRIVFHLDDDLHLVLHLMIAGRLHWRQPGAPLVRKLGLAAVDFPERSLGFDG